MKERPIIFSTPMVQAILDGRKTQTRRIVKPQPEDGLWNDDKYPRSLDSTLTGWNGVVAGTGESKEFKCPYGKIGDILWVRETWRIVGWRVGEPFVIEYKDGKKQFDVYLNESRADDYNIECTNQCLDAGLKTDIDDNFIRPKEGYPTKWRSPRFIPKEACRIRLEITDIRVERLREINEKDAIAEGLKKDGLFYFTPNPKKKKWHDSENLVNLSPIETYRQLWESINGKGSWEQNPWVWVISFKHIKS